MNRKFKVGDIVVLVERDGSDLTNTANILAKEKHLFVVEDLWGSDRVQLRSINTNLYIPSLLAKNVRHATLKERFLRTGNSIVFNGKVYLVLGNKLIGLESGFSADAFCDDLLTETYKVPITKVFNSPYWRLEDKVDVSKITPSIVLWERKPKIELTSDEVVILKNMNEKYKYIGRDDDGTLCVYEEEPKIDGNMYVTEYDNELWQFLNIFKHLFQDITFESGIHLISDLIGGNQNE